jgi:hypothetical protein
MLVTDVIAVAPQYAPLYQEKPAKMAATRGALGHLRSKNNEIGHPKGSRSQLGTSSAFAQGHGKQKTIAFQDTGAIMQLLGVETADFDQACWSDGVHWRAGTSETRSSKTKGRCEEAALVCRTTVNAGVGGTRTRISH